MRRSGREAPEHAFGTRVKFRSLPHRTPLAMHAPSSTEPLSGCCCSGGEFIPADNCTHGAGHRVSRRCCGEGVYCGGGHTGALSVTPRPRTPQQSNRTGERKSQDFIGNSVHGHVRVTPYSPVTDVASPCVNKFRGTVPPPSPLPAGRLNLGSPHLRRAAIIHFRH